jgi:glycine cleavage system H lipoate-binding protein
MLILYKHSGYDILCPLKNYGIVFEILDTACHRRRIEMVILLFLLSVIIFLVFDFILRREDRIIKESENVKRTPIFLSPDKALKPFGNETERLFHISHSWALSANDGFVYIGYDKFIPSLFSAEVKIDGLPTIGTHISQGNEAWKVKYNEREISQLAPISGKIVDVNSACKMDIPLSSDQLEKSWILKIRANQFDPESHNLMNYTQAKLLNTVLRDELALDAYNNYLNDGGKLDPSFIEALSNKEWNRIINKYFPYMQHQE